MKPRKPFQFSLATLMLAVTAYALLFAILRSLRLSNFEFLSVTLYLTTVVYSQWALFRGRGPYAASALTSGGLFVLALLAQFRSVPHWHLAIGLEFALLPAFGVGAVVGLGVAGSIDVGLMLSEIVRDIRRQPWQPNSSLFASPSAAVGSEDGRSTTGRRLAVLAALAGVFFLVMLWGRMGGQDWAVWSHWIQAIGFRPPPP